MSYLDIDEILCEEERVPCTFMLTAVGLGHLDTSVEGNDLPEQTRIELPLWLATQLHRKDMALMELPRHFERKMRDEILAGAENINLKEFSYYFYEVGSRLCASLNLPNDDLKNALSIAFAGERFRSLMMHSLQRFEIAPAVMSPIGVIYLLLYNDAS